MDKFLTKFSPFKLYEDLFLPLNNWKQEVVGSIILNQGENSLLKVYLWIRFMLKCNNMYLLQCYHFSHASKSPIFNVYPGQLQQV